MHAPLILNGSRIYSCNVPPAMSRSHFIRLAHTLSKTAKCTISHATSSIHKLKKQDLTHPFNKTVTADVTMTRIVTSAVKGFFFTNDHATWYVTTITGMSRITMPTRRSQLCPEQQEAHKHRSRHPCSHAGDAPSQVYPKLSRQEM